MAEELTDVAKAAFDASAHLIAVPDMDFRRFLMAYVKDCEGLVAMLNDIKVRKTTNPAGVSRVSQDISSASTIVGSRAESLADWARVHRQCAMAFAKEMAQFSGAALDHGKLGNVGEDHHLIYLRTDGSKALTANWDVGTWTIRAVIFQSDVATGAPPFIIASTTLVANLNVDMVDGIQAAEFLQRNGSVPLNANWDVGSFLIRGKNFRSDVVTGTQPWITASTTMNIDLNADMVDGHHAAKFRRKTTVGFITNPTTAKTLVLPNFIDAAATMVKVYAEVNTGTVDINIEERAFGSADTAGTDTLTADLQANTTGATSTTFSNAGLAADSYLTITISAKTGSPTKLTVACTYDLD